MLIGPSSIFSNFKKSGNFSKLFTLLFLLLLIAIPLFLSTKRTIISPQAQGAAQIQAIIASLSKKIDLPAGTPKVYTVSDATKLKGDSFFTKAKNGDKVLIYASAGRAYLYRPSEDKLIEMITYTPPQPTKAVAGASTSITPTSSPTAKLTPLPTPLSNHTPMATPTSQINR